MSKAIQPLNGNAALSEAVAKLDALRQEYGRIDRELTAALAELNGLRDGTGLTVQQKAAAMLAGEIVEPRIPRTELENGVRALRETAHILERASELQRANVSSIRVRLTREALPELQKEHDQLMRSQLECALSLFRAHKTERQWRYKLENEGWAIGAIGELGGHSCGPDKLTGLVENLAKRGLLTAAEASALLDEVRPAQHIPATASASSRTVIDARQALLIQSGKTGVAVGAR